jgi:hypothetical protein
MRIEFTQAARRHRLGKARVRYILQTVTPTPTVTKRGEAGWLYIGPDDRGLVIEIIGVPVKGDEAMLIVHAMPHNFRR